MTSAPITNGNTACPTRCISDMPSAAMSSRRSSQRTPMGPWATPRLTTASNGHRAGKSHAGPLHKYCPYKIKATARSTSEAEATATSMLGNILTMGISIFSKPGRGEGKICARVDHSSDLHHRQCAVIFSCGSENSMPFNLGP